MPAHLDEMNLLRKRKLRRHLDELSAYLQTSYLSQNTILVGRDRYALGCHSAPKRTG